MKYNIIIILFFCEISTNKQLSIKRRQVCFHKYSQVEIRNLYRYINYKLYYKRISKICMKPSINLF